MKIATHDRWNIPDTHVFDPAMTSKGYWLNKMCNSLTRPENREAFKADENAYMARYRLSDEQKEAVRARDWLRLVQLGGNTYFLIKIGAVLGKGLYHIGAQMRGQTLEEFLATRKHSAAT